MVPADSPFSVDMPKVVLLGSIPLGSPGDWSWEEPGTVYILALVYVNTSSWILS